MNEISMKVLLEYVNAEGQKEQVTLSDGGYGLETCTPGMVRIWGYYESCMDPYTILVPIDRVVTLAYWPE